MRSPALPRSYPVIGNPRLSEEKRHHLHAKPKSQKQKSTWGGYVTRDVARTIKQMAAREMPGDNFGFVITLATEALAHRGVKAPSSTARTRRKTHSQNATKNLN